MCHVALLLPVSSSSYGKPTRAECRSPNDRVQCARYAGGEITSLVALYGSYTALVSLSVLDLDCAQSISFPVFLCYSE